METQVCRFCGEDKPLSEFTMRRKPPIQPYQNCKSCEDVAYNKKPRATYQKEMAEMRSKAKEMRRFTPEQDVQIFRRVQGGETRQNIAKELGAAGSTVSKAYLRGRRMELTPAN